MLKGTQILSGEDALLYNNIVTNFKKVAAVYDYQEIILPSIWEAETFEKKISGDTRNQMWTFEDKGGRKVCLIPEVTGILQEIYSNSWSKEKAKPIKVFYVSKCFRYEKPQLGRLREFTQFGIEALCDNVTPELKKEQEEILCLGLKDINNLVWKGNVKRGLGYYTENGFEVECESLGAQKQVAGGGQYKEGIGWALGVERLMLAIRSGSSSG